MDINDLLSLAFSAGSVVTTGYFWWQKRRAERANLDAAWLALQNVVLREDGPRRWLGLRCQTAVANLSRLPNLLFAAAAEIRLRDGTWASGQPPRGVALGGPTPLPIELPAEQSASVEVWVWVEVPNPPADTGPKTWAKECLTWPPVLRLRLTGLDDSRFVLDLPLAEEPNR